MNVGRQQVVQIQMFATALFGSQENAPRIGTEGLGPCVRCPPVRGPPVHHMIARILKHFGPRVGAWITE